MKEGTHIWYEWGEGDTVFQDWMTTGEPKSRQPEHGVSGSMQAELNGLEERDKIKMAVWHSCQCALIYRTETLSDFVTAKKICSPEDIE